MIHQPERDTLGDVVDEAVGRLEVVLSLLNHDETEDATDGYADKVIEEILRDTIGGLRAASKRSIEQNQKRREGGTR